MWRIFNEQCNKPASGKVRSGTDVVWYCHTDLQGWSQASGALCLTLVSYWKFCLSNLVALEAGESPARMWSGLPSRGEHFYSTTWDAGIWGASNRFFLTLCWILWSYQLCSSRLADRSEGAALKRKIYDSLMLLGSNSLHGCDSIPFSLC